MIYPHRLPKRTTRWWFSWHKVLKRITTFSRVFNFSMWNTNQQESLSGFFGCYCFRLIMIWNMFFSSWYDFCVHSYTLGVAVEKKTRQSCLFTWRVKRFKSLEGSFNSLEFAEKKGGWVTQLTLHPKPRWRAIGFRIWHLPLSGTWRRFNTWAMKQKQKNSSLFYIISPSWDIFEKMIFWGGHSLQTLLGGGFKHLYIIFTPIWGRFPIRLMFFKWVETTN